MTRPYLLSMFHPLEVAGNLSKDRHHWKGVLCNARYFKSTPTLRDAIMHYNFIPSMYRTYPHSSLCSLHTPYFAPSAKESPAHTMF